MIMIIEDNLLFAECIARACGNREVEIYPDGVTAMVRMSEATPEMIFLDMLLTGPNGVAVLNELASYSEMVPVVIVSSLSLSREDFSEYNVVEVLNKENFRPEQIKNIVEQLILEPKITEVEENEHFS